MRLLPLALFALAACDDSVAIEIRVPDDIDAVEVELFLGIDRCKLDGEVCPGIGAKDRNGRTAGTVYDRDGARAFRAPVTNGVAEFRIAPEDLKIPVIIAIGQPADPGSETVLGAAQLLDVDLSSGARRYVETLEHVAADDTAKVDAMLWRRADQVGCVGFRGRDTEVPTFVVAQGDPDCDDIEPDLECDPLVWKARVAAPGTTCVTHGRANNQDVCTFGVPACVDGEGATGCNAGPACIPERMCSCETAADPAACLLETVQIPSLTHLQCVFPMHQDVQPDGDWEACAGVRLLAPLDGTLFQRACGQPDLLVEAMSSTFSPTYDITIDATHTVTIEVAPLPDPTKCKIELVATGAAPPGVQLPRPRTFMRLPVAGTFRAMLLPIDFELQLVGDQNACPVSVQCSLVIGPAGTTETIDACGS
jgi:hypothetical protein